jgi:glycogen synthase
MLVVIIFCSLQINLGADFGLMPSLFEPGGVVQHEFFVAGTPVIAFRTGKEFGLA